MKKLYFTVVAFIFLAIANAQIINFPDANFKAKLMFSSSDDWTAKNIYGQRFRIDSNFDGEIQQTEALQVGELDITYSNINSVIGIEYFTNINSLYCYGNNLSNLNLINNTSLLFLLTQNNQLTSLDLSANIQLRQLRCSENQITSLDLSANSLLQAVNIGTNPLTNLDMTFTNSFVSFLACTNSLLTTLDVSSHKILSQLFCSGNQLISLNLKNGSNETTFDFSNNPNLKYICSDDSQLTDVQTKINTYGYATTCQVNSYCSFTPGGTFFTIQGNSKLDTNSNGCDALDIPFPNMKYAITNGTVTGSIVSNNSGNFSIPVQEGTHTITPVLQNPSYFNISPTTATVTFPATASPAIQDFCITPNGIHQDLEIIILSVGPARPGFDATYKIIYKNKGNVTMSGNVTFQFNDNSIDFVSANPIVTSQIVNKLSWDYSNLLPFESREIVVVLNLNSPMETPALNEGDKLYYNAKIFPITGDEYQKDNNLEMLQNVVNSYDPNDKTCIEGDTILPTQVGDYVHYMIRFENTGTFPAQNIVVKDMIDTTKFDIATLIPINSSHDFVTRINGNKVEFIFENINLPFDNTTNDGYVAFKIKTKSTLVLGNTFSNLANIYFDYNFPIVTNNATTTVSNQLANQDFEFSNYFSLYPNPAKNILNIDTKNNSTISSLSIYNTLGQLVQVTTNPNKTIDVSELKSGNYFVKIISDKGISGTKFLKE